MVKKNILFIFLLVGIMFFVGEVLANDFLELDTEDGYYKIIVLNCKICL